MIIDVLVILFLLSSLARGREIGFVRQFFSTVGFFGGLLIGIRLQRYAINLTHSTMSRALVTLLVVLGTAMVCMAIAEYVGVRLKHLLQQSLIDKLDRLLGALAGAASLLIIIWLVSSVVIKLPFPSLQRSMRNSVIISKLNAALPPAPTFINDIGRLIDPNGFPQVFAGLEPTPHKPINLPSLGELQPAVLKDQASVVKIEGTGCGGIVEGSGFVAEDGLVATNAHVIAGVKQPYVLDANGKHRATPIWFDQNLDFAVLRTDNLAGSKLPLATNTADRGTPGAIVGYPGGGDFSAGPASVLDSFTATGHNIYNQGLTSRSIYELQATIIPGNSGGPFINKDGVVLGIVFAQSTAYDQVGYALTIPQITNELDQAQARNSSVTTGNCAE